MKDSASDERRAAILQAAKQTFADYGFRKTSMDDIARGAGMSRAALYLHFRNKEDIYRSLVTAFYEHAEARFAAALAASGPVGHVLADALLAKSGDTVEVMLTSPHGHELLDVKSMNATDITSSGEARLAAILSGWLTERATAGAVVLAAPTDECARVIMSALKGVMMTADSYSEFVASVRSLGAMLGQGLARN